MAAAIEIEIRLMSPMVVPMAWIAAICAAISSVALPVWVASAFTSEATTAKPRPASPARAASIVAFRARRLVWPAIAWMSCTTSPIFEAASASPRTIASVRSASTTARPAMFEDCVIWCDISATVTEISSAAAATLRTLSVASPEAEATAVAWWLASSAADAMAVATALIWREAEPSPWRSTPILSSKRRMWPSTMSWRASRCSCDLRCSASSLRVVTGVLLEHLDGIRHRRELVLPVMRNGDREIAFGERQHGAVEALQARDDAAPDIKPGDAGEGDAEERDRDEHRARSSDRAVGDGERRIGRRMGARHERADLAGQRRRSSASRLQRLAPLRDCRELLSAQVEDALGTLADGEQGIEALLEVGRLGKRLQPCDRLGGPRAARGVAIAQGCEMLVLRRDGPLRKKPD